MSLETLFGENALPLGLRIDGVGVLRLRTPCVSRRVRSAQDDSSVGTVRKMPALLSSPAYSVFRIFDDDAGFGQFGSQRVRGFEVSRFAGSFHLGQLLIDLFVA